MYKAHVPYDDSSKTFQSMVISASVWSAIWAAGIIFLMSCGGMVASYLTHDPTSINSKVETDRRAGSISAWFGQLKTIEKDERLPLAK